MLLADENRHGGALTDKEVAAVLEIGKVMVARVRQRFVEEGLEAVLNRKHQVNRQANMLDGTAEERLITVAYGKPPKGRATWTLRLLADRLVELEEIESISTETVRRGADGIRLRIPAQRHEQFVHAVRAVVGLAAGRSDGAAYQDRLGAADPGSFGRGFSRQTRGAGDGQPEHVRPGVVVRAFPPAEARRLANRMEIQCTPKHGGWLNMAEIGALIGQSLDPRLPDRDSVRAEVMVWQADRNRESMQVNWCFTTADGRIKLKSLHPSVQL